MDMRKHVLFAVLAAALALLALPAGALGAARDRNRDGLPDRWERKHRLSLKVKQGRRDPDRDGLSNRSEYRERTNPRRPDSDRDRLRDGVERRIGYDPRDRDSDDDGVLDGDENAGTVASFANGVLTIALARGGSVSGRVTRDTEMGCEWADDEPARAPRARSSRFARWDENEDNGDFDDGNDWGEEDTAPEGGDPDLPDPELPDTYVPGAAGLDAEGEDEDGDCAFSTLAPGTAVREAALVAAGGELRFTAIELVL